MDRRPLADEPNEKSPAVSEMGLRGLTVSGATQTQTQTQSAAQTLHATCHANSPRAEKKRSLALACRLHVDILLAP